MAKKAKAVVSSNTETNVEPKVEEVVVTTEVAGEQVGEEVVVNLNTTDAEVVETIQPSMLASMLQQEVKPLEEVKEEAEVEEAKAKVEKNQGVGAFVRKLIAEGLTNTAILKIVHEQYGNKQTTYACVAWYRNKMKKAGQTAKIKSAQSVVEEMLKNVEAEVQTSTPEEQD